jgi:acetolactate synthase I/II/III large subunit
VQSVADRLAETLAAHGVERVFGFPGGGSNLALIDALDRAGVAFVLTRGEVAAAIMAATTAELAGVPGVVVVGNGPGLTSVVNGVAHAHLDRVPLLVISDRFTDAEQGLTGHQILDQRALLEPVVKWSATLAPETVAETAAHALAVAGAAPCGAVHLDVPRDVASAPGGGRPREASPRAPSGDLGAVVEGLAGARRPLLAVGLEARTIDVAMLAERLGAAVLTTYKAKGALPADHPRWAGILTGGEIERPVLDGSDAVLALGLDPVELLSRPWTATAPVYALRTCDAGLDYLRPRAHWIGPLETGVEALGESAGGWPEAEIASEREAMLARLRLGDTWRFITALRDELPPRTAVSVDAGAHMFPATVFWRADGPFLMSNGLATMGFAVPAAIAAALADPDAVSLAITGDGGFAYHGFELETAARVGAKVVVVVINDASLSLIRIKHERPGRTLDFGPVDFGRVGEALGVAGAVVRDVGELRAAARDALARPGSTVIDVRCDGREYGETLRAIRG